VLTAADALPARSTGVIHAVWTSLRPHQWTKNLAVFAALVLSKHLFEAEPLRRSFLAFVLFCALSGTVYLLNDVADFERDRLHPLKRLRPIARGALPRKAAALMAIGLAIASTGTSLLLGPLFAACAVAYLILNLLYSFYLKDAVILDVLCISLGFVLRAVAGALAIGVVISEWLLVCTLLLALFLALAKRRGELVLVGAEATPGRPVLEGYSLALVDQLVTVVAASTVISYCLYTFTARESKAMMITIPFVLFGVFRYLLLMHRRDLGEEPEEILLRDLPILVCIAGWAVCAAVILAVT
jgi:4-hydroxybenzoate polyprenyltransferase